MDTINKEVKMNPKKINEKEMIFIDSVCKGTNKNFNLEKEYELESGERVYSIRPHHATYFYPEKKKKTSICLHFTAGCLTSDIATLTKESYHVSVPYVIDRGGRIYELFDDSCWSYHLGSGAIGGNTIMSQQSIGIEISNYGCLSAVKNELMTAYNTPYCTLDEVEYYERRDFRGKKFFASMSSAQISSTAALLKHLCQKYSIPMNLKNDEELFESGDAVQRYTGIFTHANVRKDKFDWPMTKSIKSVMEACMSA